jgi:hypothetical protein
LQLRFDVEVVLGVGLGLGLVLVLVEWSQNKFYRSSPTILTLTLTLTLTLIRSTLNSFTEKKIVKEIKDLNYFKNLNTLKKLEISGDFKKSEKMEKNIAIQNFQVFPQHFTEQFREKNGNHDDDNDHDNYGNSNSNNNYLNSNPNFTPVPIRNRMVGCQRHGMTILMAAISFGNNNNTHNIVNITTRKSMRNLNEESSSGQFKAKLETVILSVNEGDAEIPFIDYVLRKNGCYDINHESYSGDTALMIACRLGKV